MAETESSPAAVEALSEVDHARAAYYALIGRLFYAAPDAKLLAEIGGNGGSGGEVNSGAMGQAWRALQTASRSASPTAIAQEYDALFIGVGKAQVSLYTSRNFIEPAADKHLVRLREELRNLGLARRDSVFEIEDHVSGLCDVMRFLIVENRPVEVQKDFFDHFVYLGVIAVCGVLDASAAVDAYYRHVSTFSRLFFELEKSAMEMDG
jgi:TorA maturation chaperone TorD